MSIQTIITVHLRLNSWFTPNDFQQNNELKMQVELRNERLRLEFAQKANQIGPWIKRNEEELRSITLTSNGPLEVCCCIAMAVVGFVF